jgi:hypothetical protein
MNNLQIIEKENQRVLTTQQLAEVYETSDKVISNNFNRNKERYQDGKHFYCLQSDDLKDFRANHQIDELPTNINKLYLWTEKGALLHAKSLGTDKAWEVYDKLVESYFTKSVDVYAGLSTEMKALILQDKKLQVIEQKVDKLENNMTIDYSQQLELQSIVNRVGTIALGGKGSVAYKAISKTVFKRIWHDFKDYFHVNSYKNTPTARFEDAKAYLEAWQPDTNMKLEISSLNQGVA